MAPHVAAAEPETTYDQWWAGDDWKFLLSPYLWLAGASGTASVGSVSSSFDVSAADILSDLQFGGSMRLEVWKGDWRITADVLGLLLEEDGALADGTATHSELGEVLFEWGFGYQVPTLNFGPNREDPYPVLSFEPMMGGRFVYADLDVSTDTGASAGNTSDWVELFVGGRVRLQITQKIGLYVRGDAGGFGIGDGSDLTWTLHSGVLYRPWQLVSFDLAWRLYDLDTGNSERSLNMRMQGPELGVTFYL